MNEADYFSENNEDGWLYNDKYRYKMYKRKTTSSNNGYVVSYTDSNGNERYIANPKENAGYNTTMFKECAFVFKTKEEANSRAKLLKYGTPVVEKL